ncbi:MAG: YggS family pyridoxal phosphate-dependent enzyme [Bacteroidetes bacterium]|nr:YggS family pyridoxal phosphate-dependent enzyme [Bacteroidota bacterium]
MSAIASNIAKIKAGLPAGVKLIAVSKTKPVSDILEAYNAGQRIFGENKVQELTAKFESLPKDIEWHMIGHLQSNKVKYIAPFVALIHGVDSLSLLTEINKQAVKCNRVQDVLLQFYIAQEETKFGFSLDEAVQLIASDAFKQLTHVRVVGVMGMASFTDNHDQVKKEFKTLKVYFDELKKQFFSNAGYFSELSMGMSGDYLFAIAEGSTMVRIGSSVFGGR